MVVIVLISRAGARWKSLFYCELMPTACINKACVSLIMVVFQDKNVAYMYSS